MGDDPALGLYLCRRFFLLIWDVGIFRSLASPERLSSSGSSMREGKSHVPVGITDTKPSSSHPWGSRPGTNLPSRTNR